MTMALMLRGFSERMPSSSTSSTIAWMLASMVSMTLRPSVGGISRWRSGTSSRPPARRVSIMPWEPCSSRSKRCSTPEAPSSLTGRREPTAGISKLLVV